MKIPGKLRGKSMGDNDLIVDEKSVNVLSSGGGSIFRYKTAGNSDDRELPGTADNTS